MAQDTHQDKLLDKIKTEYGLGENFIQAYFHRWFETTNISEEKFNQVKDDPLLGMWFLFGLSTNQRGRLVAETIKFHIPKDAKRYLDVGCGYGGFLVAFHEMGLDANGFEIDPDLIPLSRANLEDHGIDPGKATIGNVLDHKFINQLGTFDVITCNDVMEHVNDVDLALKNMANILDSSGILLMQIPNKDFVAFINNDSHYNLFGITLLQHDDAEKYHHAMFGDQYTVGEYYEYEYYESRLDKLKCRVLSLPPLYPQKSKEEVLKDFIKTIRSLMRFWFKQNGPAIGMKLFVTRRYLKYAFSFLMKGFLSLFTKKRREAFRRQYMTDFWFMMATKR